MNEDKEYMRGFRSGFLGAMVIAIIAIVFFIVLDHSVMNKANMNGQVNSSNVDATFGDGTARKLSILQQYIDGYFYQDVDKETLQTGMMRGILESLDDPYSIYYTSEEYAQLMESTNGVYCGIGVSVQQNPETKAITVIRAFDETPAKEAGVKEGDILAKVNGEDISEKELDEVVAMIRGDEGTTVEVGFKRGDEEVTLTIVRRKIDIDTVSYQMLDGNVGYLYLSEFDGVSVKQFKKAIEELQNQGMTSLVVDIRDNPGGRLDVVMSILDLFIEKDQLLMYTETKSGKRTEYKSKEDVMVKDIPIAILINGNSASASEVFTGTMKTYGKAKVVGTTSFGKGIVQSIFKLEDDTAIKITTSSYYLPNGESIHKKGIEPDVVVEMPEDSPSWWSLDVKDDVQLQKAIETLK